MNPNRCANQAANKCPEKCCNRFQDGAGPELSPLKSSLKKSCNSSPEYSESCTPVVPTCCKSGPNPYPTSRQISYRTGTSTASAPNPSMKKRKNSVDQGQAGRRLTSDRCNGSPTDCKRPSKYEEQQLHRGSQSAGNSPNQAMMVRGKPAYGPAVAAPAAQHPRDSYEKALTARRTANSESRPEAVPYSGGRGPRERMDPRENEQYAADGGRSVQKRRDSYEYDREPRNTQRAAPGPRREDDSSPSYANGPDRLTRDEGFQNRQYLRGAYPHDRKEGRIRRLHSGSNSPEHSRPNDNDSPQENKSPTRTSNNYQELPTQSNSSTQSPTAKQKSNAHELEGREMSSGSSSPRRGVKRSNDNISIASRTSNRFHEASHANSKSPDHSSAAISQSNSPGKENRMSVNTRSSDRQIREESGTSGASSPPRTSKKTMGGFQGDDRSGYEDYAASGTTSSDAGKRNSRYEEERPSVSKTPQNSDNTNPQRTTKPERKRYDNDDVHTVKRRRCDEGCGRKLSFTSEESPFPSRGRVPPNSVRNSNYSAFAGPSTSNNARVVNEFRKPTMNRALPDDCDCDPMKKAKAQSSDTMYGPCFNMDTSESEPDERRSRASRSKPNKPSESNRSKYNNNDKDHVRNGNKDLYCDRGNCQALNVRDEMEAYPSAVVPDDCGCGPAGQVNNGSKLTVKEIIVCALRCEIMGFVMESLSLYEECIRRLRKKLSSEELPEAKAREIRQYLRNYESHAQRLRRQIQRRLFDSKLIEQIDIADNSNGNSYEKLFGKYMDDRVTEAHIYEPYMTDNCHFRNLISFLELLVKRCPNIRYIRLSTQKDVSQDSDQKETLRDICDQMENVNVAFNFRYDENLLDHKIILSNGVIIDMTRGLHYFKPWHGEYALGLCDYDFRRCCRTKIEIWLTTPFADDTNLNQNGQVCDCDSTEKLDRDYFPD